MVILLDGASAVVRAAIASSAVEAFPTWQHLALETMQGASGTPEERAFHLQLIRRCVEELAGEHMHLLLTLPAEARQYREIADALQPNCLTVHIGEESDGPYDRYIDPQAKVFEAMQLLSSVMESSIS